MPRAALREALINAVAHRNYHIPGPIKVAVFLDRVEIFSPGTFPGPISSAYESRGVTYIRNPIVTRVLRESGYVEKLGSGFITIFDTYAAAKLPEPQIYEGANYVKCILPRRSAHSAAGTETPQQRDQIIALVVSRGEASASDIAEALGISRATAQRRLAALVKSRLIRRHGAGPTSRYRVSGDDD